jgi:hypothetical protein
MKTLKQVKTVERLYTLAQKKKSVYVTTWKKRTSAAFLINWNAAHLVGMIRSGMIHEWTMKTTSSPLPSAAASKTVATRRPASQKIPAIYSPSSYRKAGVLLRRASTPCQFVQSIIRNESERRERKRVAPLSPADREDRPVHSHISLSADGGLRESSCNRQHISKI